MSRWYCSVCRTDEEVDLFDVAGREWPICAECLVKEHADLHEQLAHYVANQHANREYITRLEEDLRNERTELTLVIKRRDNLRTQLDAWRYMAEGRLKALRIGEENALQFLRERDEARQAVARAKVLMRELLDCDSRRKRITNWEEQAERARKWLEED